MGGVLADVYEPIGGTSRATVVIAAGYPGKYNTLPWTKSWAELIAAAGMNAIAYSNREPASDFLAVLRAIEAERIAVLASSGNVPVALSALKRDAPVRIACAALLYGYMLDVADAAAQFRFADPALSFDELDTTIPLLIARAGRDEMPGLDASIDSFVVKALARNVPLTLVNLAEAPHAFDLTHDSDETRAIVSGVLRFLGRFCCV